MPPPAGGAAADAADYADLLFADQRLVALARLLAEPVPDEDPDGWVARLRLAAVLAVEGEIDDAVAELQAVADLPVETRVQLWAFTGLRELGREVPVGAESAVLGVVVEVGLPDGRDLLAAYRDGSARYVSHDGGGVIWDQPTQASAALSDGLLDATELAVLDGSFGEPGGRSTDGLADRVRLSALTPAGIRVATLPLDPEARTDDGTGMAFSWATELLRFLTTVAIDPDGADEDEDDDWDDDLDDLDPLGAGD